MPTSRSNKRVEAIATHTPTRNFRGTSRSVSLVYVPYITMGDALLRVICTHLSVSPNWSLFLLVKECLGGWSSLEGLGSDRTHIP